MQFLLVVNQAASVVLVLCLAKQEPQSKGVISAWATSRARALWETTVALIANWWVDWPSSGMERTTTLLAVHLLVGDGQTTSTWKPCNGSWQSFQKSACRNRQKERYRSWDQCRWCSHLSLIIWLLQSSGFRLGGIQTRHQGTTGVPLLRLARMDRNWCSFNCCLPIH